MIEPRHIDADGKQVAVKLMDDSWTFNMCVSSSPFKPRHGVVWAHHDHCSRLPVPGDELPYFMKQMRDKYTVVQTFSISDTNGTTTVSKQFGNSVSVTRTP